MMSRWGRTLHKVRGPAVMAFLREAALSLRRRAGIQQIACMVW